MKLFKDRTPVKMPVKVKRTDTTPLFCEAQAYYQSIKGLCLAIAELVDRQEPGRRSSAKDPRLDLLLIEKYIQLIQEYENKIDEIEKQVQETHINETNAEAVINNEQRH